MPRVERSSDAATKSRMDGQSSGMGAAGVVVLGGGVVLVAVGGVVLVAGGGVVVLAGVAVGVTVGVGIGGGMAPVRTLFSCDCNLLATGT